MKTGDKVDFYIETRYGIRQQAGTLISVGNGICMIVPDGKTKAIPIKEQCVRGVQ